MAYVYSTTTNATRIVEWSKPTEGQIPRVIRSLIINGGANMNIKNQNTISLASETRITDDEAEWLSKRESFQRLMQAGHVQLHKTSLRNPDNASKTMESRDLAAPLHPLDFVQEPTPAQKADPNFVPPKTPQADLNTPVPTPYNFKKKPRFIIPT